MAETTVSSDKRMPPPPMITDVNDVTQINNLNNWLLEIWKRLHIGVDGTYEVDNSASGDLSEITLKDGQIVGLKTIT